MTAYIILCMVFPPALVAQPVFFHLWFKRVERDALNEHIRFRLECQRKSRPLLAAGQLRRGDEAVTAASSRPRTPA